MNDGSVSQGVRSGVQLLTNGGVQWQRMWTVSGAKRTALTGYAFAAAGMILSTQLDKIANWRMGLNFLNFAAAVSMSATFAGFATAMIGSVIWARRTPTRQPLKIGLMIGVASLFLTLRIDVNVHGPSAIVMFLVPFSLVNVLSLLIVTRW